MQIQNIPFSPNLSNVPCLLQFMKISNAPRPASQMHMTLNVGIGPYAPSGPSGPSGSKSMTTKVGRSMTTNVGRSMTTNVRPTFSNVPLFPNFMKIVDFPVPLIFSTRCPEINENHKCSMCPCFSFVQFPRNSWQSRISFFSLPNANDSK